VVAATVHCMKGGLAPSSGTHGLYSAGVRARCFILSCIAMSCSSFPCTKLQQ